MYYKYSLKDKSMPFLTDEDIDFKTKDKTEDVLSKKYSWQAIAKKTEQEKKEQIIYTGKNLTGGNFEDEDLQNADFSGSNLQEINFKNADLRGVNFTGADLSGADLSGANLEGAVFTGASLIGANLTKAKLKDVRLIDADIQDAVLLGIDIDDISLADLQELVEYLAKYYPHKLNLSRINLAMLDLKRIDLSQVNLRGVDFTGCDLTGVNIFELDLSECIISPAQIEQAIGHQPTPMELQKILSPKKGKNKTKGKGIDFTEFFQGGRGSFDWDATKSGTDMKNLFKAGKEFIDILKKDDGKEKFNEKHLKDKEDVDERENNTEDLRKAIEKRKQEFLDKLRQEKEEKSVSYSKQDRGIER